MIFYKSVVAAVLLAAQASAAAIAPVYKYELGLNSTAYQQKFNEYTKAGYRLTYVGPYADENNNTLFSGIWAKTSSSVAWIARHGLTGAAYDALSVELKAKKYRPVILNGYNIQNGESRFATLWEKPSSTVTWQQQRDMTDAQFKAKRTALLPLRVTTVSRYVVGGEMRFAATWGNKVAGEWADSWYTSLNNTYMDTYSPSSGYKAISMDVTSFGGKATFDYVWQRYSGGGWDQPTVWYQTASASKESIESTIKYYVGQGFGPRMIIGYLVKDCGVRYAAMFEKSA